MADKQNEISRGVSGYHFIFSTEDAQRVCRTIAAFKDGRGFSEDGQFRRMGKRKIN